MMRILRSRRGAALEGALLFMLVIFALSMLLVTSVTVMGYRNLAADRAFDSRRELEQIGVYFVDDTETDSTFEDYAAACGYTPTVTSEGAGERTLVLKNANGATVMYIKTQEGAAVRWCYGEAPQQ